MLRGYQLFFLLATLYLCQLDLVQCLRRDIRQRVITLSNSHQNDRSYRDDRIFYNRPPFFRDFARNPLDMPFRFPGERNTAEQLPPLDPTQEINRIPPVPEIQDNALPSLQQLERPVNENSDEEELEDEPPIIDDEMYDDVDDLEDEDDDCFEDEEIDMDNADVLPPLNERDEEMPRFRYPKPPQTEGNFRPFQGIQALREINRARYRDAMLGPRFQDLIREERRGNGPEYPLDRRFEPRSESYGDRPRPDDMPDNDRFENRGPPFDRPFPNPTFRKRFRPVDAGDEPQTEKFLPPVNDIERHFPPPETRNIPRLPQGRPNPIPPFGRPLPESTFGKPFRDADDIDRSFRSEPNIISRLPEGRPNRIPPLGQPLPEPILRNIENIGRPFSAAQRDAPLRTESIPPRLPFWRPLPPPRIGFEPFQRILPTPPAWRVPLPLYNARPLPPFIPMRVPLDNFVPLSPNFFNSPLLPLQRKGTLDVFDFLIRRMPTERRIIPLPFVPRPLPPRPQFIPFLEHPLSKVRIPPPPRFNARIIPLNLPRKNIATELIGLNRNVPPMLMVRPFRPFPGELKEGPFLNGRNIRPMPFAPLPRHRISPTHHHHHSERRFRGPKPAAPFRQQPPPVSFRQPPPPVSFRQPPPPVPFRQPPPPVPFRQPPPPVPFRQPPSPVPFRQPPPPVPFRQPPPKPFFHRDAENHRPGSRSRARLSSQPRSMRPPIFMQPPYSMPPSFLKEPIWNRPFPLPINVRARGQISFPPRIGMQRSSRLPLPHMEIPRRVPHPRPDLKPMSPRLPLPMKDVPRFPQRNHLPLMPPKGLLPLPPHALPRKLRLLPHPMRHEPFRRLPISPPFNQMARPQPGMKPLNKHVLLPFHPNPLFTQRKTLPLRNSLLPFRHQNEIDIMPKGPMQRPLNPPFPPRRVPL